MFYLLVNTDKKNSQPTDISFNLNIFSYALNTLGLLLILNGQIVNLTFLINSKNLNLEAYIFKDVKCLK